jgi:integrase
MRRKEIAMSTSNSKRKTDRKRRGRGEGSISQRADGLWEAKISLGYTDTGKRRRKTVYGKTKGEVQEKLRVLQNKVATGPMTDADQIPLRQYLDQWLKLIKPTVEPSTYSGYESHVRLHISSHLGGIRLVKLHRSHVADLYSSLTNAGVSAAMQRKVGTTLTIALNSAVDFDMIPSNPASRVRKPKAPKSEMRPLDPAQVQSFLAAARSDRLYALYLTALDSGARPGELFALQWTDVDMEHNYIMITKTLEEIAGKLRLKIPKTQKSRRRIDLSPDAIAALGDHRRVMLAEGHISGPVFCDTQGGYLRNRNVWRDSFAPICKRAGLPVCAPKQSKKKKKKLKAAESPQREKGAVAATRRGEGFRLYDLRHTCATLLLLADVPAKIVSERLGHSSITLTLDTYSHVLPTMQKRAAATIGKLLGGQDGPKQLASEWS